MPNSLGQNTLFCLSIVLFLFSRNFAFAQNITIDGRISAPQTLNGPNYAIGPSLGRQNGANLFQSFGAFGLKQGETATFSGPNSVSNVIGRVTGGAMSSIDGRIRSTIPNANLYLINPAGIVMGPNASVDVSGSFHASSADYLRLKDGARFQVINPDASTLSAAPPEAFGFLSPNSRPVTINGSNLQFPAGGTVGLVGGPVTINNGVLVAPAGTVHIDSAAGPGEVPVDPRVGPARTVTRSGSVDVTNNSTIYPSGGSVFIHGGDLSVSSSTIVTNTDVPGRGGVLSLQGDRSVTVRDRATVVASATGPGRGPGIRLGTAAGGTVTLNSSTVATNAPAASEGGPVVINTGALTLQNGAVVVSNANGRGNGGPISVTADSTQLGGLGTSLGSKTDGTGFADSNGLPAPAGTAGAVSLTGGTLSVQNRATIEASTFGSGKAGTIGIAMAGNVAVATGSQIVSNANAAGAASAGREGDGGTITLNAGALTLSRGGSVASNTQGSGNAGEIALNVAGPLVIDGTGRGGLTNGVSSEAAVDVAGSAGSVRVNAGSISITNGGFVNSNTRGAGVGGSVLVSTPGVLLLDGAPAGGGFTEIGASARAAQSGNAGTVTVSADTLAVQGGAAITSSTAGPGRGGSVTVNTNALTLSRGGSISTDTSRPGNTGNAGEIALNVAGPLVIDGTGRGDFTNGVSSEAAVDVAGSAGSVRVNAGSVSITNGGFVNSNTRGAGVGGSVLVSTPGALLLDGAPAGGGFTEIGASAQGAQSGAGQTVAVSAGTVTVQRGARIASSTAGPGRGGNVAVNAGALTLARGGSITTDTLGAGNAGEIALNVAGPLVIDGTGRGDFTNGVSSEAAVDVAGSAGSVRVNAGSVSITNGGFVNSNTRGAGVGGSVLVSTPGALLLDGAPAGAGFTEIGASAFGERSGNAGTVTVSAGSVTVQGAARIASLTAGPGRGGAVTVNAGTASLSQAGSITTATSGSGNAGSVALNVGGGLIIDGTSAVSSEAAPKSAGSAGTVRVNAGDISISNGGLISSSTRGAGAGGSVQVGTPGALLLDGRGVPSAAITVATDGARSGDAGTVTVSASSVTILDAAQITSSTTGQGRGGDISVAAGSVTRLNGAGPQINATSTGTGPAGSITVSAPLLSLRNGASISTEAQTANGGNITVGSGDLLYLQRSSITTSVNSAFGNGGNVTIDPRLLVLDRSLIQANAVGGNGGNLLIRALQLVPSANSAITATSQLGVSGQIFITAQPLNLNGALVVLASDLRSATALLREGCAARGAGPRSSLLMAGRGGQRQALGAMVPALYFMGRPISGEADRVPTAHVIPERTTIGLSSGCE